MSEAREMTSGADSRSALRRSFLALLSPSSALSEMVLSSPSLSFTSFGSSSSTLSPPLAFVFVVIASEQMRPDEDLRCLLKLLQEGRAPFKALAFLSTMSRLLFPSSEALCLVELGGQVSNVPRSDVDLSHLLAIPAALVVIDVAVALLQSHPGLRAVTKSGRAAERSTCAQYSSHLRR